MHKYSPNTFIHLFKRYEWRVHSEPGTVPDAGAVTRQAPVTLEPTFQCKPIATEVFVVIKTLKTAYISTTRDRFLNGGEILHKFLCILTIKFISSRKNNLENSIYIMSSTVSKERGFYLSFYSLWNCLLYNNLGMNFVRITLLKKSKRSGSVW